MRGANFSFRDEKGILSDSFEADYVGREQFSRRREKSTAAPGLGSEPSLRDRPGRSSPSRSMASSFLTFVALVCARLAISSRVSPENPLNSAGFPPA